MGDRSGGHGRQEWRGNSIKDSVVIWAVQIPCQLAGTIHYDRRGGEQRADRRSTSNRGLLCQSGHCTIVSFYRRSIVQTFFYFWEVGVRSGDRDAGSSPFLSGFAFLSGVLLERFFGQHHPLRAAGVSVLPGLALEPVDRVLVQE